MGQCQPVGGVKGGGDVNTIAIALDLCSNLGENDIIVYLFVREGIISIFYR